MMLIYFYSVVLLFINFVAAENPLDEELKPTIFDSQASSKTIANFRELPETKHPQSFSLKFSARNAHASCIFKGRMWVIGGRTAKYTAYNLEDSFKIADIWSSGDGETWREEVAINGDFWAQNGDARQPWNIGPFYPRYGHTLNTIHINDGGNNTNVEAMILLGGYNPAPDNDQWISTDGQTWVFVDEPPPWSKRGWHSSSIFKGKLYIFGGSPLTNDIWMLNNTMRIDRRKPSTRSKYVDYTYKLEWVQILEAAPFSPRVGASFLTQWYFNASETTIAESKERMLIIGGYGGYTDPGDERYNGFYCTSDVWESYDGVNWVQLLPDLQDSDNTERPAARAWAGTALHYGDSMKLGKFRNNEPPKIYYSGGGYIGSRADSKKKVTAMSGFIDLWYTIDGIKWTKISYEAGGKASDTAPRYSTQDWSRTVVDGSRVYLGLWGHTMLNFNNHTRNEFNGNLFVIGGDYTGRGDYSRRVFKSTDAIYCDLNGVTCSGHGFCMERGCECLSNDTKYDIEEYMRDPPQSHKFSKVMLNADEDDFKFAWFKEPTDTIYVGEHCQTKMTLDGEEYVVAE